MSVKKTAFKSVSTIETQDVFNNPALASALQAMTPEQLDDYQKIGEKMYNNVDITRSEILTNVDPPTEDKLRHVISGIKSGLLPTDMTEEEIMLMVEYYGESWFEKFGISKEDIGDMAKKIFENNDKYQKCGRNQKCPCGSEKKYKVCCLSRINKLPKFVQTKTMNIFQ